MKKQMIAGLLALAVSAGLADSLQTKALADTTIIEEDMEDAAEDGEQKEINWQMHQEVNMESCKQGKDVTLTVSLTGDTASMQMSTIFVVLQYDPGVFEIKTESITPAKSGSVDYISFDEDSGEIDIYYADDVSYENGTDLLKIKLHVLSDADAGATKLSVAGLELYATDSDEYAMIENKNTVKVNIKENSSAAVLLGDVNQDKKISLTDVKLIMKHCNNGIRLSAAQKKNADVNKDGKVNLTDAKLVMKYCNGEIKKF